MAAPGEGHASGPGAALGEKRGFPGTAFPETPVVGSRATPAPPSLAHPLACCLGLKGLLIASVNQLAVWHTWGDSLAVLNRVTVRTESDSVWHRTPREGLH